MSHQWSLQTGKYHNKSGYQNISLNSSYFEKHLLTTIRPGSQASLDRTLPIWRIQEEARSKVERISVADIIKSISSNSLDQPSPCTDRLCYCDRSPVNLGDNDSKLEAINAVKRKQDLDDSDYDNTSVSNLFPKCQLRVPTPSPVNGRHLCDQHIFLPTCIVSAPDEDSPPSLPPKRHVLSRQQNELFSKIPPPSTPPSTLSAAARSLFKDAGYRSKSVSPLANSPRSSKLSPQLTDSVPPLHFEKDGSPGYVPHKPCINIALHLAPNGYLKMNKQRADEGEISSDQTKPPFENLWNREDLINLNDPEYFSHSEFYAHEPLYQIYLKTTVVREVLTQSLEDEDEECLYEDCETVMSNLLKRTSEKHGSKSGKQIVAVENLLQTVPGIRKLWADSPKVKESGILNRLSSQEKKHQECLFEIITSEASYLKSLKLLEQHFMECPQLKPSKCGLLSPQDFHYLFSSAKDIISVSNRMLQELEVIWKKNIKLDVKKICQTMKEVAKTHYNVYIPYCSNIMFQERKFTELCNKPEFKTLLMQLEEASEVNGLKLQSFLVMPMQRITRLPLLIDAVSKGIVLDNATLEELNSCLAVFQQILTECNEGIRKLQNLEQLHQLNCQLTFKKIGKTIPIVSETRWLVKKGCLVQLKQTLKNPGSKGFLRNVHKKVVKDKSSRHFFLFNDLLMITKKKNDHFDVLCCSQKRDLHAEAIEENNLHKYLASGNIPHGCNYLFCLVILEEHSNIEMILCCESENERMRWIEACCPTPLNDDNEKIYEMHDCPQVQTVQRFIANEPDELNLDESDIVNVLRKTQDGWFEGERIRDGKRGWFLANHTIEIESAHNRAKNRRQRWRLVKQTQSFLNGNVIWI